MKSKKHKLLAIVFYSVIIALALVLPNMAFALQSGDFTYTVSGGTVTITGYTCPVGPAVIPSTIDGMPVVGIGDAAFRGCAGLTSVTIPGSVTSIGYRAFMDCSGLISIVVDPSNTAYSSLDGVLYSKDKTVLAEYPGGKSGGFTIPSSVTSIGAWAFAHRYALTSITIPNSVISVEYSAFFNCGLTSVTIPNSVTSIGEWAFFSCFDLTSVTIGNSVTGIGREAFDGCHSLLIAYFLGNAPSMRENVFSNCAITFTVCYAPGSTGFTTPTWYGYPVAACAVTTSSTTTTVVCDADYWQALYEESQAQLQQCQAELQACQTPPTNIELSTLDAVPSDKQVTLKWKTETETENAGFNVWRADNFVKVNKALIPAGGSSVSGSEYDFVDQWVLNGKRYFYLLEDIDTNGISTFHGPVKVVPRWWR